MYHALLSKHGAGGRYSQVLQHNSPLSADASRPFVLFRGAAVHLRLARVRVRALAERVLQPAVPECQPGEAVGGRPPACADAAPKDGDLHRLPCSAQHTHTG